MTTLEAPPATVARSRLPELDGLRAIAILLVLTTHFWMYPGITPVLNRLAASGWIGVDLFFVLSGYLITGILWDARPSRRYYRNFYARRILRIFPLYYALLLVVFVLQPLHGTTPALAAVSHDWWMYVAYLANVAIAWHGWGLFSLDITWSLAIEEQFYLCWPLVIRRSSWPTLRRILALLLIGAPLLRTLALALGANWRSTLTLTPFRLDTLAVGALIALTQREEPRVFALFRRAAPWVATALGPLLLLLIVRGDFARDSVLVGSAGYSLLAVLFGSLLLLALPSPSSSRLRATLRLAPLRRIGTVSYGIYILHPLCYLITATFLSRMGVSLEGLSSHPLLGGIAALAIYSLAAYGVAEISFRVFETPLLNLKRHFENPVLPPFTSERKQTLPFEA